MLAKFERDYRGIILKKEGIILKKNTGVIILRKIQMLQKKKYAPQSNDIKTFKIWYTSGYSLYRYYIETFLGSLLELFQQTLALNLTFCV